MRATTTEDDDDDENVPRFPRTIPRFPRTTEGGVDASPRVDSER